MPAAYLRIIVLAAAGDTMPGQERLLRACGLGRESIEAGSPGIPLDRLSRVLAIAMDSGGPAWHLRLAQKLEAAVHGPLGFAALTAPTFGAALGVLVAYGEVRFPFLQFTLDQAGGSCVLACRSIGLTAPMQRPVAELAILGLLGLIDQTSGRNRVALTIELAGPAPAHEPALRDALGAPVTFGGARDAVRFPRSWLDLPCPLADAAMHRLSVSKCGELLAQLSGRSALESSLRRDLLAADGVPLGLTVLAARRNMSARTLMRHLKRLGTSYQAIVDDVRAELAAGLLTDTDLPVASIAHRLGFSDPSNFGRAFRSWHGCSPGRYRSEHG